MTPLLAPVDIGPLRLQGNLFAAPMAGYTDRVARAIALGLGADLAYTEMISAEAVIRKNARTAAMALRAPGERVLAVQLFGSDPKTLAAATSALVEAGADLVDLNAGCPVPKVVRGGSGAALGRDASALEAALSAMVRAAGPGIPVTVKIRSGWDAGEVNWKEALSAAESAGAAAVGFHPRTRAQRYGGRAEGRLIGEMVASTALPVIGSGDLSDESAAFEMLESTGCAAVMLARGAVGNPWIYRSTARMLRTGRPDAPPSPEERKAAALAHLDAAVEAFGEQIASREIKKHFSGYVRGWPGAPELRKALTTSRDAEEMRRLLEPGSTDA